LRLRNEKGAKLNENKKCKAIYPLHPCKSIYACRILVTLVIIGVIAAFTIPTLINKTNEQERKSQFKKAYSTLSQALYKTVMNDFYGYVRCSYYMTNVNTRSMDYTKTQSADCSTFYDKFSNNLSVQKVCRGNSKSDGCIPTYVSYSVSSGCTGFS